MSSKPRVLNRIPHGIRYDNSCTIIQPQGSINSSYRALPMYLRYVRQTPCTIMIKIFLSSSFIYQRINWSESALGLPLLRSRRRVGRNAITRQILSFPTHPCKHLKGQTCRTRHRSQQFTTLPSPIPKCETSYTLHRRQRCTAPRTPTWGPQPAQRAPDEPR